MLFVFVDVEVRGTSEINRMPQRLSERTAHRLALLIVIGADLFGRERYLISRHLHFFSYDLLGLMSPCGNGMIRRRMGLIYESPIVMSRLQVPHSWLAEPCVVFRAVI